MKFPSSFLSAFQQKGAVQSANDGIIGVPRILQPVIELPEEIARFSSVGDSVAIQNTSFAISNVVLQTNGAGGVGNIVIIGRGIWDLIINSCFQTNYTDFATRHDVEMVGSPFSQNYGIHGVVPQTNTVPFYTRMTIVLGGKLDPQETFTIRISIAATGVGQTVRVFSSVTGNRLG